MPSGARRVLHWLRAGLRRLCAAAVVACTLALALGAAGPLAWAQSAPPRTAQPGPAAAPALPSVALFYGAAPPWASLQMFDEVVVDPDHVPQPSQVRPAPARLTAYVSVGEVHPSRAYASRIPKPWLVGDNPEWGGRVIDQSQPAWPAFFVREVIGPLWAAGYRSFFLDTLDAYHRIAHTNAQRRAQEDGLVAVIGALKAAYPQARLSFNRGFEILPRTHPAVAWVAAESLFQRYDAAAQRYVAVPAADRDWLLGQFQIVRQRYHLPALAIDYVAPIDKRLARQTAQRIRALGVAAYVSNGALDQVGVGSAVEPLPRRVLMIHSALRDEFALRDTPAVRYAALPLNHLGLFQAFAGVDALPSRLPGDLAGVVVWLNSPPSPAQTLALRSWLRDRVLGQHPLALVHPPTDLIDPAWAAQAGLRWADAALPAATVTPADAIAPARPPASAPAAAGPRRVEVTERADWVGLEASPRPNADDFLPLLAPQAEVGLRLRAGAQRSDAVALTAWGGYVLTPFAVRTLAGNNGDRWVVDPFVFFSRALQREPGPVPDVSTESGRRLWMTHMDGDGFVSRSELPGHPIAGQVVLDRVARAHRVPMTLSVIEAEIAPNGLYPALSALAESVAQQLFALPHVRIASHSYSHPFNWRKLDADPNAGYNLHLPGYEFDLAREIQGSARYIDTRLAPPGKRTEVFLWTGNCVPGSDAIELADQLGLLNMNGGDTVATQSQSSLTNVEGLGLQRAGGLQVFAPNQNENVYTHNWTGPFYGFERVLETYALTETPRRLKPIDLYFHTYITTKPEGLLSLERIFASLHAQALHPIQVSDYIRMVRDFDRIGLARSARGWRVQTEGGLRTLRLPSALGEPDLAASTGVAGYSAHADVWFVHLAGTTAELVLHPPGAAPSRAPRLDSANARITAFSAQAGVLRWQLQGQVPLRVRLANVAGCKLRVNGRPLVAPPDTDLALADVAATLQADCRV